MTKKAQTPKVERRRLLCYLRAPALYQPATSGRTKHLVTVGHGGVCASRIKGAAKPKSAGKRTKRAIANITFLNRASRVRVAPGAPALGSRFSFRCSEGEGPISGPLLVGYHKLEPCPSVPRVWV
jgi:hypothetical protein